jgi:hypothetical protein
MGKEDEIRIIAYSIWEEEGCVHGHDYAHWFRAKASWEEKQKTEAISKNVKLESKSYPKKNELSSKMR